MKKALIFVWEVIKIVVISLIIIIPVRYYLVQPFFVRGSSMEPNFDNGQYLVINEIGYRFENPDRGEVIVFRYPFEPSQYYIKRIIGLPGEVVEIKNGHVAIYNEESPQGKALDESAYLSEKTITQGLIHIKLSEDEWEAIGIALSGLIS